MEYDGYDEVVRAWIQGVYDSRGNDAKRTLKFCYDIEQYALKKNDAKLLGFAYYYSAETYYLLNESEKFFFCITKGVSYLNESNQWKLVARAYNLMAITAINRGNEPIALDYYLTGLNFCTKYQLKEEETMIDINLGNLYLSCGQYLEAQRYFEHCGQHVKKYVNDDRNNRLITCVYIGMGTGFLFRDMPDRAAHYVELISDECAGRIDGIELLSFRCFKARVCHATGKTEARDECIRLICEEINTDIPIMDIFGDLYEISQLLLDIGNDDAFLRVMGILEPLTWQSKIVNLQRQIISLKIKFYRMHKNNDAYLEAAGQYYELSEVMEKEKQAMIANMLDVRESLERANKKRREIEEANIRLQEKSETDALTRLANRFRLNDYLDNAFERAQSDQTALAMEILDIDYFKQYNDNYGHQAGDECIKRIAGQLEMMQNDRIFCARYGGDEFIILYQNMTEEEVRHAAEGLRQRIMDLAIRHAYSQTMSIVTISQGICYDIPKDDTKSWDFLHAADAMLYHVKKKSRNDLAMGHLADASDK